MRLNVTLLILVTASTWAWGQEYRIGQPTEPVPAPVYVTRPVEGHVTVDNLPAVQDVRLVAGPDAALEVQGQVSVRTDQPLPVEVMNLPEPAQSMEVRGSVRVDDERPLRVWVANPMPETSGEHEAPAFAAYATRGTFSAKETRVRQPLSPPEGRIFHLSDLTLDVRPDAVLKVRILAGGESIVGAVSGMGTQPFPVAILDSRRAVSLQLGTPVPLGGPFFVEVESLGPGQGAPFVVVAGGYLSER